MRNYTTNHEYVNNLKFIRNKINDFEYYKNITKIYIDNVSKMHHDVSNHNVLLLNLIDSGEYSEAKNILLNLNNELSGVLKPLDTGNSILDIILSQKKSIAMSKNINFEYSLKLIDDININQKDFSSLIFNILDNALESAEKSENPTVHFKIVSKNKVVSITCDNSTENSSIAMSNITNKQTSKHDKENHGLGISIIEYIVDKHQGFYKYQQESDTCISLNIVISTLSSL
ncbi:MAG: GHKL domain-containing protein [Lachnospirales bacterium]